MREIVQIKINELPFEQSLTSANKYIQIGQCNLYALNNFRLQPELESNKLFSDYGLFSGDSLRKSLELEGGLEEFSVLLFFQVGLELLFELDEEVYQFGAIGVRDRGLGLH